MTAYHLLSDGGSVAKLRHMREELNVLSAGLYLAPANVVPGANLCPASTHGCRADCLFYAGLAGRFASINHVRAEKTKLWVQKPQAFVYLLERDLETLIHAAEKKGAQPVCRLNCTSDIAWMNMGPRLDFHIEEWPQIQFYDYTKLPGHIARHRNGQLPANYHLTFSLSETNDMQAVHALGSGLNVAVPMHIQKHHPPQTFSGYPTIDGDLHDYRFLDPPGGHIVVLSAKGSRAKADRTSGFVKEPDYQLKGASA